MSEVREQKEIITLICNGPSSDHSTVSEWGIMGTAPFERVFRINHWYLNQGGAFGPRCDHWFIGEHSEAVLPAVAYGVNKPSDELPTIWFPGLKGKDIEKAQSQLHGFPVRIQKHFNDLPSLCRWDHDPRPRRPLTGSFALAVAVGMQPDELYIAGMDLYQHERGQYTNGIMPPDHQEGYVEAYINNRHGNHSLLADLRYIRNAFDAFSGKVICVGSVMKKYFADDYKKWEWIDG